jgi:shikimate dehydrogenase
MSIGGSTLVLGVFGDPIAHSQSPFLQNEFARETGADTVYVPFRVRPENLGEALNGIPALSLGGVNITVPHKEACLSFMDELRPAAKAIGAVNTVINQGGRLVGDNTDAAGFMADLRARFPQAAWEGKPALVLGAGGAARAVAYALQHSEVPAIRVANRTEDKARELVSDICPDKGMGLDLAPERLNDALAQAGLVVNTTSLGLKGEPLPNLAFDMAASGTVFYDLIYNPPETPFLAEARERGLKAANGLGMLVRQGAISFELWTGLQPSVEPVVNMLESQQARPEGRAD